ncbi:MAG: hypothetical protein KIC56_02105 [Clostridium sp.]|jgi:uncharacterized protein YoaH (UPF0181 family)|nr:hypothetical protein [Clostridium sp.]
MTEEQERAIERCNKLIETKHSNWIGVSNQKAIETVLNMIKEKDVEIKKYKRKNKELSIQLLKIYKEQDNYNARIEKKDKIIELMTLFMSNLDIDEEICKHQVRAFCDNKPEGVTLDVCAKCIKQYFERKVEKE